MRAHLHSVFRSRLVRILGFLAVAAIFLSMPMPHMGRIGDAVADLLHAPCFAVLAAFVYGLIGPRTAQQKWRVAVGVWLLLVVFGLGAEYTQDFIGRSASVQDAVANVAGITAGLLWAVSLGSPRVAVRRMLPAAALILILVGQSYPWLVLLDVYLAKRAFPQLASFEQPLELWRWQPHSADAARVRDHATDGQWAMRLDLEIEEYPGAILELNDRDWTSYDELTFDCYWDAAKASSPEDTLEVIVKITDVQHNDHYEDRFHQVVILRPNEQKPVRISLADVANAPADRWMNMSEIEKLELFLVRPDRRHTLYIDNMRLSRSAASGHQAVETAKSVDLSDPRSTRRMAVANADE